MDTISNLFIKYCESGNIEQVRLLLETNNSKMDFDIDEGLKITSEDGHTEIVKLLLENGADPSAQNCKAIILASENKHIEIVNILIKNPKIDLNSSLFDNNYIIIKMRDEKIIKELREEINKLNYSPHSKEFPFGGIEVGKAWVRFNPERYIPMYDMKDVEEKKNTNPESLD